MSIVIIIENLYELPNYLTSLRLKEGSIKKYMYFGKNKINTNNILDKLQFTEISWHDQGESFKEVFIKEYIELIGNLGKKEKDISWWATDIASKNRFQSKLPLFLSQLSIIAKVIETIDYDYLVIIGSSREIRGSLFAFLRTKNLNYMYHRKYFQELKTYWWSFTGNVAKALYIFLLILHRKWLVRKIFGSGLNKRISSEEACYVIKTFVYNHSVSESGVYLDAFFGVLPDFLKKRKRILVYADIAGDYRLCLEKIIGSTSQIIFPMEALLSCGDLIKALGRFLTSVHLTCKSVPFFGYDVSHIINNEIRRTYNGIPFYQFLYYWATKKLLRQVKIDSFILTYENNPWEKMCIMAIRESLPKTKIIGYQHTVVPQASTNMFVSKTDISAMILPDKILTVGKAPKEIMEKYGNYKNGMIETSCGLRFEYLFNLPVSKRKETGSILLALEGIFEVYEMVNYVLRQLMNKPEYTVTIRTHPVLPLKSFKGKLIADPESMPNFNLSTGRSLKDDIMSADIIIYWGTTVALEGLSMGKPVIHYDMGTVLSYDPLFECRSLKWTVTRETSLHETIQAIYNLSDEEFYRQQEEAKRYLGSYFYPVTEDNMQKFIIN